MDTSIILPHIFTPTATELFSINAVTVAIPKRSVQFEPWRGTPVKHSFGGKTLLQMDGKPMFAELMISEHFKDAGWNARWVGTYGRHMLNSVGG